MADKYTIEFRVSGEKFDVESVTLEQIGNFLISLEKVIAPIVIRDNPSLAFQEGDVIVSLSSISKGSLVNVLETRYEREVNQAIELTADALISQNYHALPISTIEGLREIVRFNRKHNSATEIWEHNGHDSQLVTITQTTRIRADNFITKGTTTLYGTLMRIGGDNPPRAWVKFIDGTSLGCRIKSTALARRMAPLLYQRIGIRGIAQWDTRDMSLFEFRIEELSAYRQKPVKEGFDNLRSVLGQYVGLDDEPTIEDLRGNSESDL
jgi:hypothetical protein